MSVIDKIDSILNEASSKEPKDIKSIWDAGEEEMDGFSEGGRGISQFGEAKEGKHLGKKLKWKDLSDENQKHVIVRIKED